MELVERTADRVGSDVDHVLKTRLHRVEARDRRRRRRDRARALEHLVGSSFSAVFSASSFLRWSGVGLTTLAMRSIETVAEIGSAAPHSATPDEAGVGALACCAPVCGATPPFTARPG